VVFISAILREQERVQARRLQDSKQGRKRRVTTTHADHEELAKPRRHKKGPFRVHESGKEPDSERPGDIHDERSQGKKLTATFSNKSRYPKSGSGPKCAAHHYQDILKH
jgi:hypothetical protein